MDSLLPVRNDHWRFPASSLRAYASRAAAVSRSGLTVKDTKATFLIILIFFSGALHLAIHFRADLRAFGKEEAGYVDLSFQFLIGEWMSMLVGKAESGNLMIQGVPVHIHFFGAKYLEMRKLFFPVCSKR
jgi:hypothetical protein